MSDASDIAVRLALMRMPGVGPATMRGLRAAARAARRPLAELAGQPVPALSQILPPGFEALAPYLAACGPERLARAEALCAGLAARGVTVLPCESAGYPGGFRALAPRERPDLLFARGNPALLNAPAAAIAGTRTPTAAGERFASAAAAALVRAGCVLVSGGAAGVDTAAHAAALGAGGATLVVLACGALSYRPPIAWERALGEGRLAVISQFAPQARWATGAAVTRNASISALARLVLVVEPHRTGGSIRTARAAREQGRPLYFYGARPAVATLLLRAGGLPLGAPQAITDCLPAEPPAATAQAELFTGSGY